MRQITIVDKYEQVNAIGEKTTYPAKVIVNGKVHLATEKRIAAVLDLGWKVKRTAFTVSSPNQIVSCWVLEEA